MTYLVLASVILLAVFFYLLIHLKKSIHLLYVIPFTIFFTLGTYFYINSIFGYSTERTSEEGFRLLSYHVDGKEEYIFLWILLDNETIPKSVFIPYSRKIHEELVEGNRKLREGKQLKGNFKELDLIENQNEESNNNQQQNEQSGGGTDKSAGGSLSLTEITVEFYLPQKDYVENN